MDATLNIAIRAAREAGKIIARASDQTARFEISEKSPLNYSTSVDKAAEVAIMKVIAQAYPDHSFLAEESGFIQNKRQDAVWIIDPLDGTTNFIHGFPNYVVSIAFQFRNTLEYGVIYHPLTQDLFVAARGKGAQLNEHRIRVAQRTKLEGALLSIGLPRTPEYLPAYNHLNSVLQGKIAGIRRSGASALDMAYVAAGKLDAFWCPESKLWDVAAGALLIQEAGGNITYPIKGGQLEDGHLVCGNPKIARLFSDMISSALAHPHTQ